MQSIELKSRRLGRSRKAYGVRAQYVYAVRGDQYSSDRVYAEPVETENMTEAQDVLTQFPAGAKLAVFYDPRQPSNAMLDPRITPEVVKIPTIGAAMFNCGVALLLLPFTSRRFYAADLPVNTRREGTGYLISPHSGWRRSCLLFCIAMEIGVLVVLTQVTSRTSELSSGLLFAVWSMMFALPPVMQTVFSRLTSERSGALLIDLEGGRLQRLPIRRNSAARKISIELSRVLAVGLHFRPARYARNPSRSNAGFCLVLATLPPAGIERRVKLAAFNFKREDALELTSWIRSVLQLPGHPHESLGQVEDVWMWH